MGQWSPTYHEEFLADHAIAYRDDSFIADAIMMPKLVASKKVKWRKLAVRDGVRRSSSKMAADGMPNQRRFSAEFQEATLVGDGLFDRVPIDDIEASNDAGDLELETIEDLMGDLLRTRETEVATLLTTAGTYAGNTAAVTQPWSNTTTSNPIQDIQSAKRECLKDPTMAFMARDVFDTLASHPDFVDFLGGCNRDGLATADAMARWFELERVLVGNAKVDTANAAAAADIGYIWASGTFGLLHQPEDQRSYGLRFGRTFRFDEKGEDGRGVKITQKIEDERGYKGTWFCKATMLEANSIIEPLAGFLYTGAVV